LTEPASAVGSFVGLRAWATMSNSRVLRESFFLGGQR
jgi:hypothetical protein